jgi:hypothetical protein
MCAGLQPSNRTPSEPIALGFDIMPPALRYAECLISKLKLCHANPGSARDGMRCDGLEFSALTSWTYIAKRCNLIRVGP